jgi:hypothetical protein
MSNPYDKPFSLLEIQMERVQKDLELKNSALVTLQEYEESYARSCAELRSLASDARTTCENEYAALKEGTEQRLQRGKIDEEVEYLEDFLPKLKAALTAYRRASTDAMPVYRKAPIDVTQWSNIWDTRREMSAEIRKQESKAMELVKEAKRDAAITLQYLRDVHAEALSLHKMLLSKTTRRKRSSPSPQPGEPQGLLRAVYERLANAGKLRVSYEEFSRLMAGSGSLRFVGMQNELAYLLLFLERNGLLENWRDLSLSYERQGVATKVSAQNIREAQKKLFNRNDTAVKTMLLGLQEPFPNVKLP